MPLRRRRTAPRTDRPTDPTTAFMRCTIRVAEEVAEDHTGESVVEITEDEADTEGLARVVHTAAEVVCGAVTAEEKAVVVDHVEDTAAAEDGVKDLKHIHAVRTTRENRTSTFLCHHPFDGPGVRRGSLIRSASRPAHLACLSPRLETVGVQPRGLIICMHVERCLNVLSNARKGFVCFGRKRHSSGASPGSSKVSRCPDHHVQRASLITSFALCSRPTCAAIMSQRLHRVS